MKWTMKSKRAKLLSFSRSPRWWYCTNTQIVHGKHRYIHPDIFAKWQWNKALGHGEYWKHSQLQSHKKNKTTNPLKGNQVACIKTHELGHRLSSHSLISMAYTIFAHLGHTSAANYSIFLTNAEPLHSVLHRVHVPELEGAAAARHPRGEHSLSAIPRAPHRAAQWGMFMGCICMYVHACMCLWCVCMHYIKRSYCRAPPARRAFTICNSPSPAPSCSMRYVYGVCMYVCTRVHVIVMGVHALH